MLATGLARISALVSGGHRNASSSASHGA